jgi:hypothetical protein
MFPMHAAAYATPPEKNEYVRPVALGVTACLVVWCFSGWIIDKGWTFEGLQLAALTAVFQVLGFNASAQMRRAAARGPRCARAKTFWAYVLAVTSLWTAFAAHQAYTVIAAPAPVEWSFDGFASFVQGSAVLVLLTAAATIDPLLGWAIEEVERTPLPAPAQPQSVVAQPQPQRSAQVRRLGMAASGMAASLVVAAATGVPATAEAAAPVARTEPAQRPSIDRARAIQLAEQRLRDGATIGRALARETGLHRTTLQTIKMRLDAAA